MNLTDNEIIKALECCGVNRDCSGCPKEKESYGCYFVLCGGALDLINRKKAEIEELQRKNLSCNEEIKQLNVELQAMRGATNSYKVEAERLKEFIREDQGLILKLTGEPVDEYNQKIKTETIKEFAERLTNTICEKVDQSLDNPDGNDYFITDVYTDIDNLVKEMIQRDDSKNVIKENSENCD